MKQHTVAIYCRLSRDENNENLDSLETQVQICRTYVQENRLGEICKTYIDDNVSGTTFERRGLNELIRDIENNSIDLVVTKDLSRLGRNNAKTLLFLDFLEGQGVRLIAIGDNYDTLRDEDDIIGIKTWYNERYTKDISKKIRASLYEKMRKGEHIGKAPYGYKKIEGENRLIVDENIRPIIQEIFTLYIEGLGYRKIAEIMESKKYLCPSAYRRQLNCASGWEAYHIKRIIENREYCGDTVQGVKERVSYKNKRVRKKPAEKWVVTENTHEAIITRKIWELANRIRQERGRGKGRHKKELYPFSGLLACGGCGSSMVARKEKNKPLTYICSRYMKFGTKERGCRSHSLRAGYLTEVIKSHLCQFTRDSSDELAANAVERLKKESNFFSRAEEIEKRIKLLQRKADILYNDRLEGNITLRVFQEKHEELSGQIRIFEEELNRIKEEASCINNYLHNRQHSSALLAEVLSKEMLSKVFLQQIIDKVYVFMPHEATESFCRQYNLNSVQCGRMKEEGGIWINYRFRPPQGPLLYHDAPGGVLYRIPADGSALAGHESPGG